MRAASRFFSVLLLSIAFAACAPKSEKAVTVARAASLEARPLGSGAQGLLRAQPYSKLIIEVGAVAGRDPSAETVEYVRGFLEEHLHKPGGIRIVAGAGIPSVRAAAVSTADLAVVELANRKTVATDDTISVYLMFLDGHHVQDEPGKRVLGMAYRATSIAIFEDTVLAEATAETQALVEKTVIAHELGHVLGLVNEGTPMQNEHYDGENNAGHCRNPLCLMNYALNSIRLVEIFHSTVPGFDDACLADLRAAGGK
ncbi:MAG: hypothetical protein HY075_13160 [Deltaproteobacteria bacterium]|nr:hypothetical protein [Deltaproteobacteria bacterium]